MTTNKGGRPVAYETPEEMMEKAQAYFDSLTPMEWTLTGVILALGIGKSTFYDYGQKPDFKETVNHISLMIEHSYELSLREKGRAADIFGLKNFGWKDKVETDLTSSDGSMKPTIVELVIKKPDHAS
jgi:hypothetical protein